MSYNINDLRLKLQVLLCLSCVNSINDNEVCCNMLIIDNKTWRLLSGYRTSKTLSATNGIKFEIS